jgi:hypothetical protein
MRLTLVWPNPEGVVEGNSEVELLNIPPPKPVEGVVDPNAGVLC